EWHDYFLSYMALHSELHWRLRDRSPSRPSLQRQLAPFDSEQAGDCSVDSTTRITAARDVFERRIRLQQTRRSLTVTSVALLVCFLALALWRLSKAPGVSLVVDPETAGHSGEDDTTAPPVVAVVTGRQIGSIDRLESQVILNRSGVKLL